MSFDPTTGGHRGFCFVDYQTVESAEYALANLNGFELAGRPIKVDLSLSLSLSIV
ncbi:unnamed protein product [Sphacelaria rigidula]